MAEYIELTDLWSAPLDYIIDTCGSSVAQGFVDRVKEIKPADVRPVVRGRWKVHYDDIWPTESTQECSECHEEVPLQIVCKFCPSCGADMRGEG